jgi:hypothetical protein
MKKNNGLGVLLGIVIVILSIGAMLFPIGAGFTTSLGEPIRGYDFVFGDSAQWVNSNNGGPYGGLIAAFVLGCVGGAFQLIALALSFGQGGKKFMGFMDIVGGLCFAVTAVLFFLAKSLVNGYLYNQVSLTLAWGFIIAGACAAASALLSLVVGFKAFLTKAQ